MRSAVIVAAAVAMGARAVLAASMTASTSLAGVHTNATSAAIARPTGHIEDDEECDEDDDEPTGSVTRWTTSTISATKVITVTSCAPTVTNCPNKPYVTTTVVLETTVCPVTEAVPTWTTSAASKWTTSTIYNTKVLTVTSCPPTVTNCPNKPYVTTTVEIETTVCPVTEGHPATWTKGPYPSGSSPAWSAPAGTGAWSATTKTAGVAVGTGKPVPAQTTAPITAGASKAVFGLGAAVAAVVAFL